LRILSGAWLSWNLWLMKRGEVYRLLVSLKTEWRQISSD
jgi:hypothetical protein